MTISTAVLEVRGLQFFAFDARQGRHIQLGCVPSQGPITGGLLVIPFQPHAAIFGGRGGEEEPVVETIDSGNQGMAITYHSVYS